MSTSSSAAPPHEPKLIPAAAPEPTPRPEALVSGIAWTGAVKWGVQIVTWGSTILVARLLTPEDYGLVGMAAVYLGFVTYLSEFGIGTTVVTLRDLREEQISQLNTVALILGVIGLAVSVVLAEPIARFFDAPQLRWVVIVMSSAFLIKAFAAVPMALLQRDLRFKLLAVLDGARGVLTALSMVLLAWLGFRYWTLVIGNLLGSAVLTALILGWRRQAFAWPRFATLKRPLAFSQHIITGRLSWYWYTTADFLVAGRMLGKAPLGAYTIAWDLANMIIAKVTDMVSRVTPSFFAAVQHDRAELRKYFLSLTQGIALLTFPATVGLALVADEFVRVVLGEKWLLAVAPLRILAAYAAFRSITPLVSQVLQVMGEERFDKWNTVAAGLILPLGFLAGSRWGGAGIAAAWLVLHPPILGWAFRRAFRALDLGTRQYFDALLPALSGATMIVAAVFGLERVLPAEWPLSAALAAQVGTGIVAYAATLFLFHRDRLRAFQGVVRALRR